MIFDYTPPYLHGRHLSYLSQRVRPPYSAVWFASQGFPALRSCPPRHYIFLGQRINRSHCENQVETSQRKGSALKAVASHDDKNSLNRAELIQCMCRIAVARYVLTPKTAKTPKAGKTSVTEAIVELFKTIRSHAGREVCQNSYDFRRLNCYNEEADTALRAHENALRVLFAKYSSGEGKCENSKRTLRRQESTKFVASSSKMLSLEVDLHGGMGHGRI